MTVLELRDVTRTYPGPPPVTAVRDCCLSIDSGDLVTVSGPSGSGKSTLLHLMALLDTPSQGQVLLAGIDVTTLSEVERTRLRGTRIGLVFQQFHLMAHRSVLDNVMLAGLYTGLGLADRRERAMAAIQRVGLGHRPGQRVGTLSGGEQQRVAIARALASGADVLLCDEPTGNLDSQRSAAIIDLLSTLNDEGHTLVIVSHDPDVVAIGRVQFHVLDGEVARS